MKKNNAPTLLQYLTLIPAILKLFAPTDAGRLRRWRRRRYKFLKKTRSNDKLTPEDKIEEIELWDEHNPKP